MSDAYFPEKNKVEKGYLYLVATPIGNLADLSERAKKVLAEVDFIAAEDTRNSARLLSCFQISTPLISYHEHNKAERGPQILERLRSGESCALITDAGTPAISDPGADLVVLCADAGIPVSSIPGCCASITALTLSALPTDRFCFEGFLPMKASERKKRLDELKNESRTMLFHEAPHKLKATLADFSATFGPQRRITLCREMTKINEEVFRTTMEGALEAYREREPRGEYVLVVEGLKGPAKEEVFWDNLSVEDHVRAYIAQGLSRMEAIKKTAKDRKLPKNDVYQLMLDK